MAEPAQQQPAPVLLAPHEVSMNAALVTKLNDTTWLVSMGPPVADFFGANGPAQIVRYNWNKLRGVWHQPLLATIQPRAERGKGKQIEHDLADVVKLTPFGQQRAGGGNDVQQVYRLQLCCSGLNSNCQRGCGGTGSCVHGCTVVKPGHNCAARATVTATIAQVAAGRMLVQITGSHVPVGVEAQPPPLLSLRPDPALKRKLVQKCLDERATPGTAVQALTPALKAEQDKLGAAAPTLYNARYNPSARAIARAREEGALKSRGGPSAVQLGDWGRSNMLIREHLIQRGSVLEYEELNEDGGIVVLATGASLQMTAEHGKELGATDAKHDTTLDCRAMWSTYRVPVRWSACGGVTWYGTLAWIAPAETQETISCALNALRANLPCDDPTCCHPFRTVWEGGRFRRYRQCSPAFRPYVTVDKHMPSLLAVVAAGYAGAALDGWHGYHAFNRFLSGPVLIRDTSATVAMWAFRLWTRSQSDHQANTMRTEFVNFVLDQASAAVPLWTVEQAADLVRYFLKCWHQPAIIRQGWIDGGVKSRISCATGAASTGSNEGSHKMLDEQLFKLQRNRDVCTVVAKTAGVDASGAYMSCFFDGEEKRYEEDKHVAAAGGLPKDVSVDVRLCEARAAYALLSRGADCVFLEGSVAFVPSLRGDPLKRHAAGRAAIHGGIADFPAALEPMRHRLALAGHRSFEWESQGYYTVNLDTLLCDCFDCHYHGALTTRQICKHARLAELARLCSAGEESAARTRGEAFALLLHLVHARERSKGEGERCQALYEAATEEELLEALKLFPSYPPVGTCTGLDDLSSDPAVVKVTATPVYECTFSDGSDLGICFVDDGYGIVVASYIMLLSGEGPGPAAYIGERIRPGDILQTVNGSDDIPYVEMDNDTYQLECMQGPVLLQFQRPPPSTVGQTREEASSSSGGSIGRPKAREPKFPRSSAPRRRGRKPEKTRAELQRARPALPPGETAADQVAALKADLLAPATLQVLEAQIEEAMCPVGYVP